MLSIVSAVVLAASGITAWFAWGAIFDIVDVRGVVPTALRVTQDAAVGAAVAGVVGLLAVWVSLTVRAIVSPRREAGVA